MKNRDKLEIVDMSEFAGLCTILIPGRSAKCVILALEGTKLIEMNNHVFSNVRSDLHHSNLWNSSKGNDGSSSISIVTPMLINETTKDVADRLNQALEEVGNEKRTLYCFGKITNLEQKMFPDLFKLQFKISRVENLPGGKRVPIEFDVTPNMPYFKLFLPRDMAGNFINLRSQKLCLKSMAVDTDLSEILADLIIPNTFLTTNMQFLSRRGLTITYGVGSSGQSIMSNMAEHIIMYILIFRALLRNRGFETGTDEPIFYSSPEERSSIISHKYDDGMKPGDLKIVCSDVIVTGSYNHGNNEKAILNFRVPKY